jgi:hypothetical protein
MGYSGIENRDASFAEGCKNSITLLAALETSITKRNTNTAKHRTWCYHRGEFPFYSIISDMISAETDLLILWRHKTGAPA